MENTPKKIDGRKNNPGRFGRKKQITETPPVTETTQGIEPLQINTMNETTSNENIEKNDTVTNQEAVHNDGDGSGINTENIEQADIIDESKLSDKIEEKDINHTPLNEAVVQEDYRNQFAGTFKGRVEEPKFTKPDVNQIHQSLFGKKGEDANTDTTTNQTTGKTETKVEGANPLSDNKLGQSLKNNFETPDERRQGAELLVDGVLDAYGLLHQIGAWAASVNIERLQEEQLDGKIDLGLQIPVDPNDPNGLAVPLQVFLENYNLECKKTITLDPDFVAKVRPVMIRVCEKNGWGLSDEQYLIYLFGRDLTEKVALIIGMKRAINTSLRMIKKSYAISKEQQSGNIQHGGNNNDVYNDPRQNRGPREKDNRQTETTANVMGDKKADEAVIISEQKTPELSLTINKPEENNIE